MEMEWEKVSHENKKCFQWLYYGLFVYIEQCMQWSILLGPCVFFLLILANLRKIGFLMKKTQNKEKTPAFFMQGAFFGSFTR